jgi:hypothetical protein
MQWNPSRLASADSQQRHRRHRANQSTSFFLAATNMREFRVLLNGIKAYARQIQFKSGYLRRAIGLEWQRRKIHRQRLF